MTAFLDERPKRKPRWRFAFMHNGLRYTGSAPASNNTKRAAQLAEKEEEARVRSGVTVKNAPTVKEFVAKFLEYQRSQHKVLTCRSQTIHLEQHVLPTLGKIRLDRVTREHIDELKMRWDKADAAVRTINVRLDTLKRMFALAIEWGYLASMPIVRRMKVPPDSPRFLTDAEAHLLLASASGHWRAMILIALRTGLRIGELRGLQWGDFDDRGSALHVRRTDPGRPGLPSNGPKGGKMRSAPLTPDALACMRGIRPPNPEPGDWIWPALTRNNKTRPRSATGCFTGIRAAVRRSGIKEPTKDDKIAWHTLRHTFASWLVSRGTNLRVVQDLLGHASIKQTERYAHLAPNMAHHAAVAGLDFALVESPDYRQATNALPEPDPE